MERPSFGTKSRFFLLRIPKYRHSAASYRGDRKKAPRGPFGHKLSPGKKSAPKSKDTKNALDILGEYVCRGLPRQLFEAILFLLPLGKDGEPTTTLETPVWGYFLQREVEALCCV